MGSGTRHTPRREDALSRELIVEVAVELLDSAGESGLSFRALSTHLRTGPGAIYWHVANKEELLLAATDAVLTAATTARPVAESPYEEIRAVALGLFDAVDEHPWLGTQLSRSPWRSEMLRLFEHLGQQIRALEVPLSAQFTSASALMIYIVGAARQNAANGRVHLPGTDRAAFLASESAGWERLDPAEYPFTRSLAEQLREHDDRAQFLAGVDLIVSGIMSLREVADA